MLLSLADVFAIGAHLSALDAGGDSGNAQGLVLAMDHDVTSHVALRAEFNIDKITMHSDEQPYAFTGEQFVAMAGVRFDLLDRDTFHAARPYASIELGFAAMDTNHDSAMESVNSFRLQPLALGLDAQLGADNALRAEVAASYYNTYEEVLAVSLTAAFVHRL